MNTSREVDILLVDDNIGDVMLTKEALKGMEFRIHVSVATDGIEAMDFLRQQGRFVNAPRPDLVLLDLNMPRKNGAEVLAEVKGDADLKSIPIVVLSTSDSEDDVRAAYQLHANCYVTKPVDLDSMIRAVQTIESFWMSVATLPKSAA